MTGPAMMQNTQRQTRCSCLAPFNHPTYSAVGYALVGLFLSIPFSCGALFGVTSWACDRVLNFIYTKTDINQNNTIANIVKFALRFFAHAVLGMVVLGAIGCPLSFGTAALFAAMAYLVPPYLVNVLAYPYRTLINVAEVAVD